MKRFLFGVLAILMLFVVAGCKDDPTSLMPQDLLGVNFLYGSIPYYDNPSYDFSCSNTLEYNPSTTVGVDLYFYYGLNLDPPPTFKVPENGTYTIVSSSNLDVFGKVEVWIDTPDFYYEPVSGTLTITNSSDVDTGSYTMTVSGTFSKHDKSLRDSYIGDVAISGTANVVQEASIPD